MPRERERGVFGVEPGEGACLLGVRQQHANGRRRLQETIDAERRDEAGRADIHGEAFRPRALDRGSRGGFRASLQERVTGDQDGPRVEGRRQIVRREPGARSGIGDDRRTADDDDAAGRRIRIERQQRLDAVCGKRVGHQPAGGVCADPADDCGTRLETRRRARCVRGGPARAELDAAVHAGTGNGCRKCPVEHHVADSDQVIRHSAQVNLKG